MESISPHLVYSVKEAAELLGGKSKRTVFRLIKSKKLAAAKSGKSWLIPGSSLLYFKGEKPLDGPALKLEKELATLVSENNTTSFYGTAGRIKNIMLEAETRADILVAMAKFIEEMRPSQTKQHEG